MIDTIMLTDAAEKELLTRELEQHIPIYNFDVVPHRNYIVALNNNQIIGLIAFVDSSARKPDSLGIGFISTHVEHRAKGVATAMIYALFEHAVANNKNIANSEYEPDGLRWLKPLIDRISIKFPSVKFYERY